MPLDNDLLLLSSTHQDFDNQSIQLNMSPDEHIFSPLSMPMNSTHCSSVEFSSSNDPLLISNELPSEINIHDVKTFQKTHDDYSTKLYQAFLKFQYDCIEQLMQQFWSLTNIHFSQANDLTYNGMVVFAY